MPQYRKKPVEIEARWLPTSSRTDQQQIAEEIAEWCGGYICGAVEGPLAAIKVPNVAGEMLASPGDYVIKGVQGEFYPCTFDVFTATYEPA